MKNENKIFYIYNTSKILNCQLCKKDISYSVWLKAVMPIWLQEWLSTFLQITQSSSEAKNISMLDPLMLILKYF